MTTLEIGQRSRNNLENIWERLVNGLGLQWIIGKLHKSQIAFGPLSLASLAIRLLQCKARYTCTWYSVQLLCKSHLKKSFSFCKTIYASFTLNFCFLQLHNTGNKRSSSSAGHISTCSLVRICICYGCSYILQNVITGMELF